MQSLPKLFAAVISLLAFLITPACLGVRQAQKDSDVERPRLLSEHAARAKRQGKVEAQLPNVIPQYEGVRDLAEALQKYTLLLVEPVSNFTTADTTESKLWTWHKLRIAEDLSKANLPAVSSPPGVPSELLPLADNEFLIREEGGSMTLDGIRLNERPEYGVEFKPKNRFLLLVAFDPLSDGSVPTRLASIPMGPSGVFRVDAEGKLAPISTSELFADMQSSGALSLPRLKNQIRKAK